MKTKKHLSVDSTVLHELLTIGNQMSNLCYHFGNNDAALQKHHKTSMAELTRQWDAKLNHLRETYK